MFKIKYFLPLFIFLYSFSLQAHVVCIHGFCGAAWNMHYYANDIASKGETVTNWDYPSRDKRIEEHAEDLVKELQSIALESPSMPIHFVTHSMGGLVLRAAIIHPDCPEEAKIGKAVLLAPPNRGACWGRFLDQFSLVRKIAKEQAGKQLMTMLEFDHLGEFPPTMDVLVIAGNWSLNLLIPGENDGTVAVSETYLNTPHHHAVLNVGHKSILLSKQALKFTKQFIGF